MKIKKNVIIMYAIALFQGLVFYCAIATLYRQAVGVSVFQITIIESISLALSLVLELPWGILAEKIGYRNTMIVCNVLYFISKIIFWQASGFGMFLLERILLSVVLAGVSGVDTSVLYLSCDEKYIHKAFGLYNGLGTTGLLIAAGVYTVFLIGVALFSESHQTITVFLNQLQYQRAGMSDQMIGLAYVVVTIVGLLSVRSAHFTNKLGKRKAGAMLMGISAICCMRLAVTKNPWISIVAILLLRVAFSLAMPLVEVIENEQITYKNRATALSIYSVIIDAVAITTNLIFGKTSDIRLSMAFVVGFVFCIIGMLCYLVTTRKFVL